MEPSSGHSCKPLHDVLEITRASTLFQPKIAAEVLYKDIDNLELHVRANKFGQIKELTSIQVGLQAEETKQPSPGAGLCPGYTMSRAILADAISLTRSDRFLTIEFTRACPLFCPA
jgi:hypothetical protein